MLMVLVVVITYEQSKKLIGQVLIYKIYLKTLRGEKFKRIILFKSSFPSIFSHYFTLLGYLALL
jgi:hypothetical protein